MAEASLRSDVFERATFLENFQELEDAYRTAALQGDSTPPENPEDEVDFHYICYVKSRTGRLYAMDGDKQGPEDMDVRLHEEDDLLSEKALSAVRRAIQQGEGNVNFSLMALGMSDAST